MKRVLSVSVAIFKCTTQSGVFLENKAR